MRKEIPGLLVAVLLAVPAVADKKSIVPSEFAASQAPYTPGILVDGTLYISGQIGQDVKTSQIPADFEAEVKTCLDRVGLVLKAAGMGFEDAVSVQVYLTDMDLFARLTRSTQPTSKLPVPPERR